MIGVDAECPACGCIPEEPIDLDGGSINALSDDWELEVLFQCPECGAHLAAYACAHQESVRLDRDHFAIRETEDPDQIIVESGCINRWVFERMGDALWYRRLEQGGESYRYEEPPREVVEQVKKHAGVSHIARLDD